jgi:AAA+ superfamily predicted ATPase
MVDMKTYNSLHKRDDKLTTYDPIDTESEEVVSATLPEQPFEFLVPTQIKGFNLRTKTWLNLEVDRLVDVQWNKEAFSQVVMDSKAKDLIRALVSRQTASERSADIIGGKGNGLILLLHGSPGTGKILTAESVAEIAEKPLYRVTCADVGTQAEDVERYLQSVFILGKRWNCVVLLDEADVFLEQRGLEDLRRNALVSVFIRVLEYYEGILVLTSNRVGTFDEAFKSRIQLALHYPSLGQPQRMQIWMNFIDRLKSVPESPIDIGDLKEHLVDLSKKELNGREIRNALTTAQHYAEWKKETLNYKYLDDVIGISMRFGNYLETLHGVSADQLAEEDGFRLAERRD